MRRLAYSLMSLILMLQIIQIPSLAFFTYSLVALLVILVTYWKRLKTPHTDHDHPVDVFRLPPGPCKLPLIGNLHQLVGSLPHHSLRDLTEKHGPIMHLKLGQVSAIVISSPELAKAVLSTHETAAFSQRPTVLALEVLSYNLSGLISCPYNDYWRQMRKICVLELLNAKRVRSFASIREEEALNLVESINYLSSQASQAHPTAINLSKMIFSMQNSIIARAAFGKKCKYQQEFISLVKQINILGGGFEVPDLFPSLKFLRYVTRTRPALEKIHQKIDKILDEIINDHKMKRTRKIVSGNTTGINDESSLGDDPEDLVDVLLQLEECGRLQFDLTTDHIKSVTLDIYSAGSDTSASATEWAMSELLRNPRAMEKAQAEVRQLVGGKRKVEEADMKKLSYLKLVIRETLRLRPPGPLIPRLATQTCKISGYDIPSEAKVIINAWAIGRDPTHWDNADCFKPERFQLEGKACSIDFQGTNNFELIPFGGGKRVCPGISFGIASIEVALSQLLYHFNWKLPNGTNPEDLDMTESSGIISRRKNDLYVMAIPFIP